MGNKISIVIPTRNRLALLRSTLRSVRGQTWPDKELIVVDEASTDDTAALLANEFPEVKVIRHDVARGPAGARNAGIAASSGDWVFFLDDDDLIHPKHLEELLRAALAAPLNSLVSGRMRDFAVVSGEIVLSPVICAPASRPDAETLNGFFESTNQPIIAQLTILWPRRAFDSLTWDEELAFNEDFDLYGQAILAGKHIVGREAGMYYIRSHAGPRITTGANARKVLSPALFLLKWSKLLHGRPEHRTCANAISNGLMATILDFSGLPVAARLMPLLVAAFRAWGGQRFYMINPPPNRLKRFIAQAILDLGGPSALRRFLVLVAKRRYGGDIHLSSFQPAVTEADRTDAAVIRTYQ